MILRQFWIVWIKIFLDLKCSDRDNKIGDNKEYHHKSGKSDSEQGQATPVVSRWCDMK
jgi:hypothetical protein